MAFQVSVGDTVKVVSGYPHIVGKLAVVRELDCRNARVRISTTGLEYWLLGRDYVVLDVIERLATLRVNDAFSS